MIRFTYPSERYDEQNIDKREILHLINKHVAFAETLKKKMEYYAGNHEILSRSKKDGTPNNKLVCNHAKDISDTATSYFIGEPIAYKAQEDITLLTNAMEDAGADEADGDNGLDLSIYGLAYDYVYAKKDKTALYIKNLPVTRTFMVYDDTIEENELFAVYYYAKEDSTDRQATRYVATVLTQKYKYVLEIDNVEDPQPLTEEPKPHYMGEVPITEYRNNKLAIGDFELQIPLIDAYNAIMSDRVNDKEQFIDSILAIYGTLLADDDYTIDPETGEGDGQGVEKAMEKIKKRKVLEMPGEGAKAEYLTHTFDESGVELLRKAIEQDIHKFSHIPCMTDESFGGNVSGVAMEFKLLGMENITKIKTRYYKKGIRKRLRLFRNWLALKGNNVNIDGIKPTFTRCMPKNLLEISQWISNLWGKVSRKTLITQIPFVDDVDAELKAVEEEENKQAERQKQIFGGYANEPLEEKDGQQEET